MKALRIQNLRSIVDTGIIPLKPLTLLVGRNSSGKSTFLRTFPLLRQSVEARTTGPVLWYGPYVDFGSFETALWAAAEKPEMKFEFLLDVSVPTHQFWQRESPPLLNTVEVAAQIILTGSRESWLLARRSQPPKTPPTDQEEAFTRSAHLRLSTGDQVEIRFSPRGQVQSFNVNKKAFSLEGREALLAVQGNILPRLTPEFRGSVWSANVGQFWGFMNPEPLERELEKALRPFLHGRVKQDKVHKAAGLIRFGKPADMLRHLASLPEDLTGKHFQKRVSATTVRDPLFQELRSAVLANIASPLLMQLDGALGTFFRGVAYIAPVRATAERYYRAQDLSVDEVDFKGNNLPMYLHSLPDESIQEFSSWLNDHLGFAVATISAGGHISINLQERNAPQAFNLADMGFGFSQVLPIAAQMWRLLSQPSPRLPLTSSAVFAMEQPELHLHPSHQARVADFMMASIKSAVQAKRKFTLLVETHSSTIVNRVGNAIANGEFAKEDAQVVIFEREASDGRTDVSISEYDGTGNLMNWPYGFFEPR